MNESGLSVKADFCPNDLVGVTRSHVLCCDHQDVQCQRGRAQSLVYQDDWWSPERVLPTTINFVDIAGLVAGASKGEGLGNKFLTNIRETDAIVHVVRCFESDDIVHVAGRIHPIDDIDIIHTELALADLDTVEKSITRSNKLAKSGQKDAQLEVDVLERLKTRTVQARPSFLPAVK